MAWLSAIPLPIRIALMFVLPLLVVQWLTPYSQLFVLLAALLIALTAVSLLYANGSLNALARVPGLSRLLDALVAGRPKGAAGGPGGSGSAAPSTASARKALSDEERNRLYAEGQRRLHALVGVDEAVETIERRLVDVARASSASGDRGFGTKAPALVVIVSGPRGVGKSEIARSIAEIYAGLGALETGSIVRLRVQDVRGNYAAGAADVAREKLQQAREGAFIIEDADWLLSDPGGLDVGLALLDAVTEQHQKILVLLTMSESGERRLRADNEHARWLGKLAVRSVSVPALDDDDLLDLLERCLDEAGGALDGAARGAAKTILRDERARLGPDHFDNAIACRRIADRLLETSIARLPDGDGPDGSRLVTRDDLRVALDSE